MYINHYRTLINGSAQISRVFVNLVGVMVVSACVNLTVVATPL